MGGQRVVDPDEDPGGDHRDDQDGAVVDEDRDDGEVGCEEQQRAIQRPCGAVPALKPRRPEDGEERHE